MNGYSHRRIVWALFAICTICILGSCSASMNTSAPRMTIETGGARLNYGVDITITPLNGVTRMRRLIVIEPEQENTTYTLSGYFCGQIVTKTKNTQLKLDNVYIEQVNGKSALLCKAKTEISTVAGSKNYIISTGRSYIKDGALHGRKDLVLGGSGTLYVKGNVWHGVEADDIKIKGSGLLYLEGSRRGAALTCETLTVEEGKEFRAYFLNAKNGIKADKNIAVSSGTFYLYDNATAVKADAVAFFGGKIRTFGNTQLFVTKKGASNVEGAEILEEQWGTYYVR